MEQLNAYQKSLTPEQLKTARENYERALAEFTRVKREAMAQGMTEAEIDALIPPICDKVNARRDEILANAWKSKK